MQMIILVIILTVTLAACGASKEAKYTPDPSIIGLNSQDNADDQGATDDQAAIDGSEEDQNDNSENDQACGKDEFCLKTCESENDCSDGYQCIMNICTFDCQSDSDCGVKGKCNDVSFCELASGESISECNVNDECGNGRFCNTLKACEKVVVELGCMSDIDCPPSQYCTKFNECNLIPAGGFLCNSETPCPSGYYCDISGLCEQNCRTSFQCGDGEACDNDGQCVKVGAPSKLSSFSFSSVVAAENPTQTPIFKSKSYQITNARITSVGRNDVLTSPRFRLTGNVDF